MCMRFWVKTKSILVSLKQKIDSYSQRNLAEHSQHFIFPLWWLIVYGTKAQTLSICLSPCFCLVDWAVISLCPRLLYKVHRWFNSKSAVKQKHWSPVKIRGVEYTTWTLTCHMCLSGGRSRWLPSSMANSCYLMLKHNNVNNKTRVHKPRSNLVYFIKRTPNCEKKSE